MIVNYVISECRSVLGLSSRPARAKLLALKDLCAEAGLHCIVIQLHEVEN